MAARDPRAAQQALTQLRALGGDDAVLADELTTAPLAERVALLQARAREGDERACRHLRVIRRAVERCEERR